MSVRRGKKNGCRNKIGKVVEKAQFLAQTQRKAEDRFWERMQFVREKEEMRKGRYDMTQTLRKTWSQEQGRGRKWLAQRNQNSAQQVRRTYQVILTTSHSSKPSKNIVWNETEKVP